MSVVVVACKKTDCVNKGKELCAAGKINVNEEGECTSYYSFEDMMKRKPKGNWRR